MAHDFKRFPELTNSQLQFYYFDSPHRQITESFDCKVVKVTDGDTIRVDWKDRDFDFPIRLSNIQAPELDQEGGRASRDWLAEQLSGQEIRIEINPENRVEKFGRLLGEVIAKGINVNEMSMALGFSEEFA